MTPQDILERLLAEALYDRADLRPDQQAWLEVISSHAENQKAVLAALLTSLVKKIETPHQDIRLHKTEFAGGYSGRGYDTAYITPFIRDRFPRLAMKSGSGWLTRSIEQAHPFNLDFPGRISNSQVKQAFLAILDDIETHHAPAWAYARNLLAQLIVQQQDGQALVDQPIIANSLSIHHVLERLHRHFFYPYHSAGASVLPVLAIYSALDLLMGQARYQGKQLRELKAHTTSDQKSRTLGDIEVVDSSGRSFEVFEVKHNIPIKPVMIQDVYEKIRDQPVVRYLLLTTHEPNVQDQEGVEARIDEVRRQHGCEIIVNGVLPTLKYTLRLIDSPSAFVERYTSVLRHRFEISTDLKKTHLKVWNELIGS